MQTLTLEQANATTRLTMAHKKNSHQSRWSFHPISSFVLKELSQTICSADVTVGIQSLYSHSGLAATMVLGQ